MDGTLFQSWESFLGFVREKETDIINADWENANYLFDVDYLQADEWEGFEKILEGPVYQKITARGYTLELRSAVLQEHPDHIIFYAVGEENPDGCYKCIGYAIVNSGDLDNKGNQFVSMLDNPAGYYQVATVKEYFNKYQFLKKDLPGEVLDYLYSQVEILDYSYGADRDIEKDLGGFCAVIPKKDRAAKRAYQELLKKYSIQEHLYEYLDIVTVDGTEWLEALYLLNSDYGIILISQKGVET